MSWSVAAQPDAPDEWNAFARAHGTFYHEREWAHALHDAFGFRAWFLAARDDAGRLVGILPLAEVRTLRGRRRLVSLPFSYAAGPVATSDAVAAALYEGALTHARARAIGAVEIKRVGVGNPPGEGYERATRYATYVVPTAGGEAGVWARLHASSTRRGIKKGEREGVVVGREESAEAWQHMADLQAHTSHRHGLPAPPDRFFTESCRRLQSQGLADLYLARTPGGDLAAGIVLWKGARAWIYAFGASLPQHLELRPNHVLLWTAMRDAIAAGVDFDLGRAAPEQSGLVEFKERWGGAAVPLAYDYWPKAAGLNTAPRDRGPIAWANRAWAALPPSIARRGSFLYRYLG